MRKGVPQCWVGGSSLVKERKVGYGAGNGGRSEGREGSLGNFPEAMIMAFGNYLVKGLCGSLTQGAASL